MCQLIDQLLEYLKRTGAPSEAICKASLRKLEHMYYKVSSCYFCVFHVCMWAQQFTLDFFAV